VTSGASARTITLPTASANTDRTITIRKVDTGAGKIIIDGEGSETIDGLTVYDLNVKFDYVTLLCDGTSWYTIDSKHGWVNFTPVVEGTVSDPTFGTGTYQGRWKRDGKDMIIHHQIYQTAAGTAGSGRYIWPIPAGYSIDTTDVLDDADSNQMCGNFGFAVSRPGSNEFGGFWGIDYTSAKTGLIYSYQSSSTAFSGPAGSGSLPFTSFPWYMSGYARVPITEFS
jgi:hypothetical protein